MRHRLHAALAFAAFVGVMSCEGGAGRGDPDPVGTWWCALVLLAVMVIALYRGRFFWAFARRKKGGSTCKPARCAAKPRLR